MEKLQIGKTDKYRDQLYWRLFIFAESIGSPMAVVRTLLQVNDCSIDVFGIFAKKCVKDMLPMDALPLIGL